MMTKLLLVLTILHLAVISTLAQSVDNAWVRKYYRPRNDSELNKIEILQLTEKSILADNDPDYVTIDAWKPELDNDCIHLDVHYFVEKFPDTNGYLYWMAYTPSAEEDPNIVVSNDGLGWIQPPNASLPRSGSAIIRPDSDTNLNQWNPSFCIEHYSCVNEAVFLDHSYLTRLKDVGRDEWTLENIYDKLPDDATIDSVVVAMRLRKIGDGIKACPELLIGIDSTRGTCQSPAIWTTYYEKLSAPGDRSWSKENIDSLRGAVVLSSDGAAEAGQCCSQFFAVVYYTTNSPNPIDPPPSCGLNTDADLFIDKSGDTLWCGYRHWVPSAKACSINVRHSVNGSDWSSEANIIATTNYDHLSPAWVYDGIDYRMYYVARSMNNPRTLRYKTACHPKSSYSSATQCTLYFSTTQDTISGRELWHINVEKSGDYYYATIVMCDKWTSGINSRLHFGKSTNGVGFDVADVPFLDLGSGWDRKCHYRASSIRWNDYHKVWYPGSDGINWRMGYAELHEGKAFTCGDATDDGSIDLVDAIYLGNYYFGKSCEIIELPSDVNCDHLINLGDALIIGKYYFGIPGFELNCCD